MNTYTLLSDVVLILHFAFVAFVVGGFLAIWLGWFLRWEWVRNRRFRFVHLLAIGFVVLESIIGMVCPLTVWEQQLRVRGGGVAYEETFIQHWLGRVIFFDASEALLNVLYAAFFLLVIATLWLVPPRRRAGTKQTH
jgi:hypothetical protein